MSTMASQEALSSTMEYRPARELPFELRQHCGVYFEEHLYTQALHLLLSLLSSGTVASGPAFVPPPPFLAVAATLVVHPTTTTRAKNPEAEQAANLALQLLRLTNKLVGPVVANFRSAFTFTYFTTSRHGGRRRLDGSHADADMIADVDDTLAFELAQSGSLWSRAEDFWHVVGWAFNCSVLHPKRWTRWKLWLEFMCDAMEDDWAQRELAIREMATKEKATDTPRSEARCHEKLKNSLIFKYISSTSGIGEHHRRIFRAIFADGSAKASNEFREIFVNELKEIEKKNGKPKKREADVNIDEDIYGDYATASDEEDEETRTRVTEDRPARPKRSKRATPVSKRDTDAQMLMHPSFRSAGSAISDDGTRLGDMPAFVLRKRLLQLLSSVSCAMPKEFKSLPELYDLFVENIKPLPLPIFQLVVSSPIIPGLSENAQSTLCEKLLFELLEDEIPESKDKYLSQDKIEECFLPYVARKSTVVDNAKISILLETCLRLSAGIGDLVIRPSLKEAVEEGILARAEKAQNEKKKSQDKLREEEVAWVWLLESGERLTYMVDKLYSNGDG